MGLLVLPPPLSPPPVDAIGDELAQPGGQLIKD
jgi:hypothetical protein